MGSDDRHDTFYPHLCLDKYRSKSMSLLNAPDPRKLLISAALSAGGVVSLLVLKQLFPEEDLSGLQSGLIVAISTWLINTVREATK
jgi:hypothetical protein